MLQKILLAAIIWMNFIWAVGMIRCEAMVAMTRFMAMREMIHCEVGGEMISWRVVMVMITLMVMRRMIFCAVVRAMTVLKGVSVTIFWRAEMGMIRCMEMIILVMPRIQATIL